MRDTNEGMIELLGVSDNDNIYSSVIKLKISNEELNLRFGIECSDYARLKSILQYRPFENTGVAPYRYFFSLSYGKKPEKEGLGFIKVRVEQLDRHKEYEFCLSVRYISNILWFRSLKDKSKIEQMIEK